MVDAPAPSLTPSPPVELPPGRFAALRVPNYRVLWVSSLFLYFAVFAQNVARGWLAIELTGTSVGVGGVYLALGIAMLVMGPIGGVIADRFEKRRVLLVCNLAAFAGAALIAVGSELGFLEYWMLLVSGVLHGASMSVMGSARMAFIGELVERPLLPNAAVLQQIVQNSTRVAAPAVAGALIGIEEIGSGGVYVVTSTCILIGALITFALPRSKAHHRVIRRSPFGELVDGIRHVRSQRPVWLLLLVATVVVAACQPFQALLPAYATQVLDVGSSGYGFMMAGTAIGAVIATFWFAGLVHRVSVWRIQALCGLGFAIAVALLGLAPTFVVALVVLFGLGGASAGYQATNGALGLLETDLEYHGRVLSLFDIGFAVAGIIALPLGFLADAIGLRATLAIMGVVGMAATMVYMLALRRQVAAEETMIY